jgi:hypothetical protein
MQIDAHMHAWIHAGRHTQVHTHTHNRYRSLGVILYFMLCGFHPFDDAKYPVMFNNIKKGRFTFPSPFWDNISAGAKDLISVAASCLHPTPFACIHVSVSFRMLECACACAVCYSCIVFVLYTVQGMYVCVHACMYEYLHVCTYLCQRLMARHGPALVSQTFHSHNRGYNPVKPSLLP